MNKRNIPCNTERKPQVGYQSHIIDKINDLSAASPYNSRNEFLDACVQILDDLERYTLERELSGHFGRHEILLLASILKSQDMEFYPSTRYKDLVAFKVSQILKHIKLDPKMPVDKDSFMERIVDLTEIQAYTLLITIKRTCLNPATIEIDLFTAFNPKDYGYLVMSSSSIPLYKADHVAGRDPEEGNYILGKKYTINDAERLVEHFEKRDREAGLFIKDQYQIFELGKA